MMQVENLMIVDAIIDSGNLDNVRRMRGITQKTQATRAKAAMCGS